MSRDLKPDASQVAFDLGFDFLERGSPSELVITLKAAAWLEVVSARAMVASVVFLLKHNAKAHQVSNVNPTFTVTCQCATLLFSRLPRTSATSNHFMLRIVFPARPIALFTASSIPFGEEPTNSIFL